MSYVNAVVLAVIQGLTEFLPISSSGHLVLAQHLMGLSEGGLFFGTVLHAGTAASILLVFRTDILGLARGAFSFGDGRAAQTWPFIGAIALGSVPAAVAGLTLKDYFEAAFMNPKGAGAMLLVTAVLLFLTLWRSGGDKKITLWAALVIGCAQAFAIFPGVSRSGATIAAALLVGVSRQEAGRFSFLLALPVIFGAAALQASEVSWDAVSLPLTVAGFLVSFGVGVVALKTLLAFVRQGRLHYFAYYCVAVGGLSLLFIK